MREPERIHSSFLFPAIVLLLVAQPMLAALSSTAPGLEAFPLLAALVASIWSLDRGGRWFRAGLALGLLLLVAAVARLLAPSPLLHAATFSALAALSMISVILGVRWLFAAARITVETLLSAVSVYLLIGLSFAMIYVAIYTLEPSAFHGVSPGGHPAVTAELVYFSIGTLSTSALGDVLPMHPTTRLLTNIESVTGQLYLAVLVAILITGYTSRPRE